MKKLLLIASLMTATTIIETKNVFLTNETLKLADDMHVFDDPIIDILKTRESMINFVLGAKKWSGVIANLKVSNGSQKTLTSYFRRPETMFGATFVAITVDHSDIDSLITDQQKEVAYQYVNQLKNKSFYTRQVESSLEGVFTGSYAINPINGDQLPIYISDYAIEGFDIRKTETRLGVPAHNDKDFTFAKYHKIPMKAVMTVPNNLADNDNSPLTTPSFDQSGNLTEVYLGEFNECILMNSDFLNGKTVKESFNAAVEYLEKNNAASQHEEPLEYSYDGQQHSLKNITKIENFFHKNIDSFPASIAKDKKESFQIILNYAQADFLAIVEPFITSAKNSKDLMISLIEESCALRENNKCYLLRWCKFDGSEDEKTVFHRDITSVKALVAFCKDLVDFLGDLAHSCPNARESLHKRNAQHS